MEQTFVMIKPDAVARGLVGEIVSRFEHKGLTVKAMKLIWVTREQAEANYEEHRGKPFFGDLVEYVTRGPVVVLVVEGEQAVPVVRRLIGATDPAQSEPGTIRGDFGLEIGRNLIHGSDSLASAEREIALFFAPNELLNVSRDVDKWVFENA